MTKLRVKFFGGSAAKIEGEINGWLDSDTSTKVMKFHRPVVSGHNLYVLVEYTQEVEDERNQ